MITDKIKRIVVAGIILLIGLFLMIACGKTEPQQRQSKKQREPLEVKQVTYLIYCGGLPDVEMYVITSDLKVTYYSIRPEVDKHYDYLAGELPSEDSYEIKEYEISDKDWSKIVNVLTGVEFMELEEDMSTKDLVDDGSSYYIKVETSDSVHASGGYCAGYDDNAQSRRFAQSKEMIENAIRNR